MSRSDKDRGIEGDDALLRLRPGAQLGRYELVAVVASGGMGRVWAARAIGQHGFRRLVALKTILPSFAAVPEFEQRFLDEARLASQIHHPNVCQIDDLGEANGILYMALEWIDGAPLSELYRERKGEPKKKPVDPRFAARIAAQVCAGLHAAHELKDDDGQSLGVVHRDVSPQNVLVGDGIVKVTDFGIAKAFGRTLQTKAGEVRGKAPYLAPEQLTASTVDRRTDVYAMGALLYEIATGVRAFDGETDAQILVKVMNEGAIPPGEIVPGFPAELQSIVLRALSKRPGMRFATALEMQRALEHYLSTQEALTDGAMTQIVEDRLGAELQMRRELVKRGNVSTSNVASAPASLRSEDLLSDSDVLPVQATAPSAIDLALVNVNVIGKSVAPDPPHVVVRPTSPGKPPPVKKSATPTMPATPQAAFALGGMNTADEDAHASSSDFFSDVPSGLPSSLISAPMHPQTAPPPGFLDPDALRAARGNNAENSGPSLSPGIELENVDLMAAAEVLRREYELSGPPPKKVVTALEPVKNRGR